MRPSPKKDDENFPADPVVMALLWHEGDAIATIKTLIDDCQHLRAQLALASGVMSKGMTRGWEPAANRAE